MVWARWQQFKADHHVKGAVHVVISRKGEKLHEHLKSQEEVKWPNEKKVINQRGGRKEGQDKQQRSCRVTGSTRP